MQLVIGSLVILAFPFLLLAAYIHSGLKGLLKCLWLMGLVIIIGCVVSKHYGIPVLWQSNPAVIPLTIFITLASFIAWLVIYRCCTCSATDDKEKPRN